MGVKRKGFLNLACTAAGALACLTMSAREFAADIVIYGSTPAAISAAVQAKRMGRRAIIVTGDKRIGGLTTGGLGQTDIGNKAAFGGIAVEFYRDVATWYADARHWTYQNPENYFPDGQCAGSRDGGTMWTFEPSAALAILEGWVKRDGLEIHRNECLDRSSAGVEKQGDRIVAFRTRGGNVYRGRMFIDATYEGDLLAAAGVSYTLGREGNAVYGETINGHAPAAAGADHHNFSPWVSAFVKADDPSSGLLPGIEPYDPTVKSGDGDARVQAYCFRMCLTDVPGNRIPFAKPKNYDERNYELLFREYEAIAAHPAYTNAPAGCLDAGRSRIPFIMSRMPNGKTDTNNRCGFSSDFIGRNWRWAEAQPEERVRILLAHLDYQRGLMWTLANHPRIPADVRAYMSKFGTCRDEFQDGLGDGWQKQLYIREGRRMVGEYVMTEHNCRGTVRAARPVAMAAYTMDSHHVRRLATKDGHVRNEGNVEDHHFPGPYPIDYGAIVPKKGECANLFVPVCLSASHIAFGSIRMEPVFFALGQSAGTAAVQAIDAGVAVQDLPYAALAARLKADGQVLGSKEKPRRCTAADRTFRASVDGTEQRFVELVSTEGASFREALIALHGHGSDRWQFVREERGECAAAREVAAARGMLFVSPDYRAKTSWMGPKAESDMLDLIAWMRRERGVERIFICGGSMGGTSALTFAARHPDLVSGVVAMNPLADHLSYTNFQDAIAASFGGDKVQARGEYVRRSALNYPERFTMPVSITLGGKDRSVPPQSARELARKISFARPDLIYLFEDPSEGHRTTHMQATRAFREMFRRADAQAAVPRFKDNIVRIAAINSPAAQRAEADFLCTGEHDERVINHAIDLLEFGGTIRLADGDYYVDGFEHEGNSAIFLGYNQGRARTISIEGTTDCKAYNTRYSVGIHVTEPAMYAMKSNETYRVFYGCEARPKRGSMGPYQGDFMTYTHLNNLNLRNMQILFANATKTLIGVDGRHFGSMHLKKLYVYTENYFRDRFMHIGRPDIPVSGTVGVWSVPGSNDEAAEIGYDHVQVGGLHTGFVFDGVDHLIMQVSGACRCVQGYDFRVGAKTLTIINCADEGNTYLPRFRGKGGHVTMIDFNVERFNPAFIPVDPCAEKGEPCAVEDHPGSWRGSLTYTMQGNAFGVQEARPGKSCSFFAPGCGAGFEVRDLNR